MNYKKTEKSNYFHEGRTENTRTKILRQCSQIVDDK